MQEANKSIFRDLLIQAYHRTHKSPSRLATNLGVPRQTVKTWLKREDTVPRNVEDVIAKLERWLAEHRMCGENPCSRSRMWQAMRCLGVFIDTELAAVSNTSLNNAQQFSRALYKAGYLRKEKTANGRLKYQLLNDTGPKAPTVMHNRATVYDNNLDLVVTT